MAGFVGEAVLSGFIQKLVDMVTSPDLWKFARQENFASQLQNWQNVLLKIQAVLNDAEEKQLTERPVKLWLDDLRDLAYDVEDILDDFATEDFLPLIKPQSQQFTDLLRRVFSNISTILPRSVAVGGSNSSRGSRIEEITTRLQNISAQKNNLNLTEIAAGSSHRKRKRTPILPTTSLIFESRVYGREADKAAIVDMLLKDDPSNDEISVIPVVGMGGIGKTTLAQLAFNDDKVKDHFELRAWVCISDDFNVLKITKTILQSVDPSTSDVNDFNLLQVGLKKKLCGKKFLLVLDDVWNENSDAWDVLCLPMRAGAPGSKIMVTTRNQGVVSVAGTCPPYALGLLSYNDCLSLFIQQALRRTNFDAHSHLKEVGEEIVRRCKGLPLAVMALGRMLRNQLSRDEWAIVLKSKIWDLPAEKNGILPALKLSYHHLPSHLKQCFAYCSMFPKDYEFDKDELVLLWMAEGFLQQREERRPEDLGSEYFHDLFSRSFFQASSQNSSMFVMHDLIHDLAQSVAGGTCFNLDDKLESKKQFIIWEKARHSTFNSQDYETIKRFKAFHKVNCLRTLVALPIRFGFSYISSKLLDDLLKEMKCLRVLSLSGFQTRELPDSIGNLKHLRYLNLSDCHMTWLPDSVGHLYNLQALILSRCWELTKLPMEIGNLINLRHLDIMCTSKLQEMPAQMGNLTNLQTLSKFIVTEGSQIRELKNLLDLRGRFSISGLHNVVDIGDARDANLEDKFNIEELEMKWSSDSHESRDETNEMHVLERLQPHRNLKKLTLAFYGGPKYPSWIRDASFPLMTHLILKNCKKCTSLPSLGRLSLLKKLHIEGMSEVKSIDEEFYGGIAEPFQSLEFLKFEDMPKWEDWAFPDVVEAALFPCLVELTIRKCSKLASQLPHRLRSLVKLDIMECPSLAVSISKFASLGELNLEDCNQMLSTTKVDSRGGPAFWPVDSGLKSLEVRRCDWLVWVEEQRLPCSLKTLKIENCGNMEKLPNGMQSLVRLEELEIKECSRLESFADTGLPPMLKRLVVEKCRNLKSLPHPYNSCALQHLGISYCPSLICFPNCELPTTLKKLRIISCEKLESLPEGMMNHNSTLSNNTRCLEELQISYCKSLKSFPKGELPSTLKRVEIWECRNLESMPEKIWPNNTALTYLSTWGYPNLKMLPECLKSLKDLRIGDCENLEFLPHQMRNLTSLQSLFIWSCPRVESFPEVCLAPKLTSLSIWDCKNMKTPISEWGLHTLTSLSYLHICEMYPDMISLSDDDCLLPKSLTTLQTSSMESLASLAIQNLVHLKQLGISSCPRLHSLGRLPATLERLIIFRCPIIKEKCIKEKGEYWPNIAHLPYIHIDGEYIH